MLTLKKYIILYWLFPLSWLSNFYSQTLFYADHINGGVTGGGFSTNQSSGSLTTDVFIPSGSQIKKAFLFATCDGLAPDIEVVLNGNTILFDETTICSIFFNSYLSPVISFTNSTIRSIEITNIITAFDNIYTLTIPNQPNSAVNGLYSSFYIFIVYENLTLDPFIVNVFLNNKDVNDVVDYTITPSSLISHNINTIGLTFWSTFFCDTLDDGSYLSINGYDVGLLGGKEYNTLYSCTGVYANYSYYNDSLIALGDDNSDSLMNGTDGLANIKGYLNGNQNIDLKFTHQVPNNINKSKTNPVAGFFLTYTTPCDTFTTTLTDNVSICKGDTAFLAASGGIAYEWLPQVGLSCYNCATPYYTDTVGRVYTCRIWNTDSCSKVLPVKINVLPLPIMPSITVNPTLCSGNTGHIQIANQPTVYTYTLDGGTSQTTLHFNNLSAGDHLLNIKSTNGCSIDTLLTVAEANNVVAQFAASPTSGNVPLTVNFTNQSTNATNYSWYIENDTLTTTQASHTFDTSGVFTVTLVAYNTYPHCSDTATVTIVAEYPFTIIAPSLYVSDENYTPYQIYTSGVKELHYELFTDQGKLVYNKVLMPTNGNLSLWNSNQLAKGIYLYRIWAVDDDGVEKVITGKVVVM